ncbi:hypothetical protein PAXRUDRAFT_783004 [Paxillus rubicundulus Ve08.2h10]|uniref:Unplaced genomic scaffold scaffold_2817, whole genome shotgun sequence n=1 Tax=Paxillus rubicundulus Ve08.2h10 TaxID=930991 RepID=A0A0D0CLK1_9AGAM|nr:hypothetical protein PAXRUDRAFT_783004 [Paxillus rubicundulus Ve08.2h10]
MLQISNGTTLKSRDFESEVRSTQNSTSSSRHRHECSIDGVFLSRTKQHVLHRMATDLLLCTATMSMFVDPIFLIFRLRLYYSS